MTPVETVPQTPADLPVGAWTFVALPDTQHYAKDYPAVFDRIVEWIIAHRETHRILFVGHLGDIVDANVHPQWINAHHALYQLHRAKIPFALTTGNHDIHAVVYHHEIVPVARDNAGFWDLPGRGSLINHYFEYRDYRHSEAQGFFELGCIENSWQTIGTPTGELLVLALEYGPRAAVIDWANAVLAQHADKLAIVLLHEHLYMDGARYDWPVHGTNQRIAGKGTVFGRYCDILDAEEVWQRLLARHANIRLVLCGHVGGSGTAHLPSPGAGGSTVHQLMSNYQPSLGYGGGGYIRLLRFLPDRKTLQVRSYSPWYDDDLTDPGHRFDLTL